MESEKMKKFTELRALGYNPKTAGKIAEIRPQYAEKRLEQSSELQKFYHTCREAFAKDLMELGALAVTKMRSRLERTGKNEVPFSLLLEVVKHVGDKMFFPDTSKAPPENPVSNTQINLVLGSEEDRRSILRKVFPNVDTVAKPIEDPLKQNIPL